MRKAGAGRGTEPSRPDLEQFVSIASHELKAPLRRIVNLGELLARRCRGVLDAGANGLLAQIRESAVSMEERLAGLVRCAESGQRAALSPRDLTEAVIPRGSRGGIGTAPRPVLLVEDDPCDAMLMREALQGGGGVLDLQVAGDGDEATAYLRGEGRFAGAARPSLVLLDWRLPKKSGEEVLRDIRGDPALKLIPVVVLTTSGSERDVRTAYSLGANAFLTKPTGLEQLRALGALIEGFWLIHASLPSVPESLVLR